MVSVTCHTTNWLSMTDALPVAPWNTTPQVASKHQDVKMNELFIKCQSLLPDVESWRWESDCHMLDMRIII